MTFKSMPFQHFEQAVAIIKELSFQHSKGRLYVTVAELVPTNDDNSFDLAVRSEITLGVLHSMRREGWVTFNDLRDPSTVAVRLSGGDIVARHRPRTGRYALCDSTCTTDCGHCKGHGIPLPECWGCHKGPSTTSLNVASGASMPLCNECAYRYGFTFSTLYGQVWV